VLTRNEALTLIARTAELCGAAVFVGNGLIPRALRQLADREENFYMVGSMGLALPLAIGFSRHAGVPTIAVEGDGNALMGLSGMCLAPAAGRPLVHVVLDNQGYESTGGQASPAPGFAFTEVARAARYSMSVSVKDGPELARALDRATCGGHVCLIHVHTARDPGTPPPRVPFHPAEITERFTARFRGVGV
jgi:thiamine pyrophosphate-dependent acetolactate synthase large subunit-like protein